MKYLLFLLLIFLKSVFAFAQCKDTLVYEDVTTHQPGNCKELGIVYWYSPRLVVDDSLQITLSQLAEFHFKHPNYYFEIQVHTDQRGSERANLDLSQRRAEQVLLMMYVFSKIDTTHFTPVGYGETQPIIPLDRINATSSEAEKEHYFQMNRRTLVVLSKIEN